MAHHLMWVRSLTTPLTCARWVMTGVTRRTLAHCHLIWVMIQRHAQAKLEGKIVTGAKTADGAEIMSDIDGELGSAGYLVIAFAVGTAG